MTELLERLKRLLAEDPTLAARLAAITGDGNVVGDHNVATVNKLSAGDYAIQIGQLHLTLSPEQLRSLPVSADTASRLRAASTELPRQLRVFLCHASGDKPAVRDLYRRLRSDGIAPWLAEEDLLPGQDWQLEIPKAVRSSDAVIICLSSRAITKAGYVQKEIKYALDVADEQPEGAIFLIPVRLEECEVPERLQRWQWVDFFQEKGYDRLLRALRQRAEHLQSTPHYEQLQAATARQKRVEVLTLGRRILRRPPRRPRERPAWLWPVVGGVAVLLVAIGIAAIVVPRLTETLLLPTATSWPTDTRVPPTATSRPTETPRLPTATIWPTKMPTPVSPPAEASVGDTWTRPEDGMVMVYVPAGEFLMGSSDADVQADDDEKPQHTVYLDAYWIDQTEVTNAQYRKCVEAGTCRKPGCWDNENYNVPDQPVVCVSWDDAQAYAAWAGGRLPTEAEWEKAARGTDGRIYPWGNSAPGCNRANYAGCVGRPATVGSYLTGASPYGALDTAGNVWEWTSSLYWPYPYRSDDGREAPEAEGWRVLRGGAFFFGDLIVRCAYRGRSDPSSRIWYYGFRVVAAPVNP
jgi:formylglycine-generating enzyme required for sulfatase activity